MTLQESKIEIVTNGSAVDFYSNPTKAWTEERSKVKAPMMLGIIGCVFGLLSFGGMCIPLIRHNNLKMTLFGESGDGIEKGILKVLLDKSKENSASLKQLKQWANGTVCITGSGFTVQNFCYRHGPRLMTYNLAVDYCKTKGGLLAFFTSDEELQDVLQRLWKEGYERRNEIWVGLTQTDGEWMYSDGNKASFTKWARGNVFDDGFNCAQLRTEPGDNKAGYYDRRCTDLQEFLCKFSS